MPRLLEKTIEDFKYGLINAIEAKSIPRGAFRKVLNFITKGDKAELRGGELLLGTEVTGSGAVTGLGVAEKVDGTQVLYWSHGRKVKYYDEDTSDNIEIGTNLLPAVADGEDVTFSPFYPLAGNQMWFSSPNSGLYKGMVANPGDITNVYDSAKNYKGRLRIQENRIYLWGRVDDISAFYLSYIDAQNYTTVTDEDIGNADDSTKTFTGTLAFKAGGAKRTCFGIIITDTSESETFSDNNNGVLTGDQGGTGTINYTTGAFSVTFNTAPATPDDILATYQWEDSTDTGIADFTFSGTRVAGEGDVFRQDDGGATQGIFPFKNINYCPHTDKTWSLQLTIDDTDAVNEIWRNNVGIPNHRAAVPTGEGIYIINDIDESEPKFEIIRYARGSVETESIPISNNIKLADYRFDQGACEKHGDLIVYACRTSDSSFNNRIFIYNRKWKSFDIVEYWISCFARYNGSLIGGSSISNNIYQLFSGFDDDDSLITGYLEGNLDNLDLKRLKKVKKLDLEGEIQVNQGYKLYLAVDNGAFVEYKNKGDTHAIEGTGNYVDTGQSIAVGSPTVGSLEVGGGSTPGDVIAHPYYRTVKVNLDKFEKVIYRIVPQGIGYMSLSMLNYKDIRIKAQKIPLKYRTAVEAALGSAISDDSEMMFGATGVSWIRIGPDENGSWRFTISDADLLMQKKESGVWVDKQTYEP